MRELRQCSFRIVQTMKLLAFVVLLNVHHSFARKLPSTFTVCLRNDPQLNECFTQAAQKAIGLLTQPIPELSLPSIDPIKIDRVDIPPANSDNFKFGQVLTNLELHNLKATTILKSELNLNANDFNVVIRTKTPWLKLLGNYEMDGKVLLLVIRGEGAFTVSFDDVSVTMNMTGNMIDKKGKQYLVLNDVNIKIVPKNLIFQFDNLFNGNQELGTSVNKLLNDNWKSIYEEIGSTYEGVVATYLKSIGGQIFNKVPYDELFPLK